MSLEDIEVGKILIVCACICAIMACVLACFNLAAAGIAGLVTFLLLCAGGVAYSFP